MAMRETGARFVDYLRGCRPRLEAALDDALAQMSSPEQGGASLGELSRYLYGPLSSFVRRGGKRVRPSLCLLGAEAVGGDARVALSCAVALELFQAAALIHDDISDRGELRRGEPCLHVSEGVGIAVNAGDLALTNVFGIVSSDGALDGDTRLAVLSELFSMAERTLEGQALDLGWVRDSRWDISIDDYLRMATLKTAHYSAATPLVCGALCGGGDMGQVEALRTFGLRAGLAFQLRDDLLNVVGDADRQGKDYRSDITEGKRTLLAVHALAHLDGQDAEELASLLMSGSAREADLARVVALMERAGALDYVDDLANDLAQQACDAVSQADLSEEALSVLTSMAVYFVKRTS